MNNLRDTDPGLPLPGTNARFPGTNARFPGTTTVLVRTKTEGLGIQGHRNLVIMSKINYLFNHLYPVPEVLGNRYLAKVLVSNVGTAMAVAIGRP